MEKVFLRLIERQFTTSSVVFSIMLVGIILVFNGISNIWIAGTATHAAKDYARKNETVDVEFVDEEK